MPLGFYSSLSWENLSSKCHHRFSFTLWLKFACKLFDYFTSVLVQKVEMFLQGASLWQASSLLPSLEKVHELYRQRWGCTFSLSATLSGNSSYPSNVMSLNNFTGAILRHTKTLRDEFFCYIHCNILKDFNRFTRHQLWDNLYCWQPQAPGCLTFSFSSMSR